MGRAVGWSFFLPGLSVFATACGSGDPVAQGSSLSCDPLEYIAGDACVPLQIGGASADASSAWLDAGGPADASAGSPGHGPAPDPSTASAYLMNPAHNGATSDLSLTPPLAPLWTASFDETVSSVSYPLFARGRVYVTTDGSYGANEHLVAVDGHTGIQAFSVALGAGSVSGLAYDQGRVFVSIQPGGTVAAYDAATGSPQWTAQIGDVSTQSVTAPVAYRGIVYASRGLETRALDAASGALVWKSTTTRSGGSVAVSDDGVFVSDGCQSVFAFDRVSGASLWRADVPCAAGVSVSPVLSGHTLFITPRFAGNTAFDTATGATTGTFAADTPPAFQGSFGVYVSGGTLRVTDTTSSGPAWTFAGDLNLSTSPLVVDGYVYVGSRTGAVFGVRPFSSEPPWYQNTGVALTGGTLAAAEGVLVVSTGSGLAAYASASLVDAGPRDADGAIYAAPDGSDSAGE